MNKTEHRNRSRAHAPSTTTSPKSTIHLSSLSQLTYNGLSFLFILFLLLSKGNMHLAQSSSPSSYSNASTSSSLSISSLENYSNTDLNAKSYVNSSKPVISNPFNFCPEDKIGTIICAITLSRSRMQLCSGTRIQRVLNKMPSLFMVAQVILFHFLFPHTPNSTYE